MSDWQTVCTLDQVEEGMPLGTHIDGKPVAIFRLENAFYAISDICTHEHAFLSEGIQAGDVVKCPLHQARFRITDGKCLGPPAEADLQTFEVKIEGEDVFLLMK